MKHRLKAAALAGLLGAMPLLTQAAVIQSNYTFVGGTTWLADFTVLQDGNPAQISGFTIYFPENLFANLSLAAAPATWDSLVIQPDSGLMAAGYLDSFALTNASAIGAGGSQGGFRVQFNHLAATTPPALSFDINDAAFNVVFSGTTVVTAVPEPASVLLASLGLCGLLAAVRKKTACAAPLALETTA